MDSVIDTVDIFDVRGKKGEAHEFYAGPLASAFDSIATPEDWERAPGEL